MSIWRRSPLARSCWLLVRCCCHPSQACAAGGKAAALWLIEGAAMFGLGEIDALVSAAVSPQALHMGGHPCVLS